jgi:DNA modification methylase
MVECLDVTHGTDYTLYNGDCCEVVSSLPDNSIDMAIYSPPFSNLYIYSDSERDMGNCKDDEEFLEHYRFLVKHLYRVLKPGRLCLVHCKDLVNYKGRDGKAGLRDFPGDLIRVHLAEEFAYHSRVTIWKDPVIEMQRTKAHGLLYKQLRTDSTFSRQGMAEYLLGFRKWAAEGEEEMIKPVTHTKDSFELDKWQQWASPVWMDIRQTNVLNVQAARDNQDEKHICPLQLDVIERAVVLWSNPGDTVLSPFAGIGSEGYVSLQLGLRFVGVELKESYYKQACKNLENALAQSRLFA